MSLYQYLTRYRDPLFGLLGDGINPTDPSGNAVLYEAHALIISQLLGSGRKGNKDRFLSTVGSVLEDMVLLRRKPQSDEDQSHDDYTGAAAGFLIAEPTLAKSLVTFGRNHGWFFDWKNPIRLTSISSYLTLAGRIIETRGKCLKFWHRRLAGQVEHYKLCAGEKLNTLEWLIWLGSILTTNHNNTSGFLLDFLKAHSANSVAPDHWAVRIARKWIARGVRAGYGGKLGNVYARYFGKNHPFVYALGELTLD